jgi:hypothetical protein
MSDNRQSTSRTKKTTRGKSDGWTAIRRALGAQDKTALLALIKDLYGASELNRDLLQARCRAGHDDGELLEKYRRKIVDQFFPGRGRMGALKLGEARKAIRDYRKATGSLPGTADLLMTYVENGAKFTREYGDIDEGFYNSVESALKELAGLLRGEARGLYPQFAQRLASVERMTDGIGWGFHDSVSDVVGRLDEELGIA